MIRFLLPAVLLASFATAQRIQVTPSDVAVDYSRVDMLDVPGERPIHALAMTDAGLYAVSEDRFMVLEGRKMRVLAELPAPVRTLVALPKGLFLAGGYVLDSTGRRLHDYALKEVHAAAVSGGTAYAVTHPHGEFYALEASAVPKGRVYERSLIGVDEHFRAVPRAMAVDNYGAVWTSGELGFLYRYAKGKLEKTALRLPAEKGREFLNIVECFTKDKSGVIYGGTSDGYLFRLDASAVVNLGRPGGRIRALALQKDGSLLGVAGEQLFAYRNGAYELLGRLEYRTPDRQRWMAYDIDSMAIAGDGAAYFGESTFRAHLFLLRPMPSNVQPVTTGIDVLVDHNFRELQGKKVGLITNHSGFDRQGRRTIDLLAKAPGVELVAIFTPEHGLSGEVDAPVTSTRDPKTGLPAHSLFSSTRRPTEEMLKGIDTFVYDILDVGARFYTYLATLGYAMEEAAKRGIEVVVLDRPNPIRGDVVEGPVSAKELDRDFLAYSAMPTRYGMTIGEMATMWNAENRMNVKLTVVKLEGWQRSQWFDETGLAWVNPSPALRNMSATALYPATNMLYITGGQANLSLGRGTDSPYEVFGAPWVNDERALAAHLNARGIPGVRFLPLRFTPRDSVFKGQDCGGVFVLLLDRDKLNTGRLGIEMLSAFWKLYPNRFSLDSTFRRIGSRNVVEAIKAGKDPLEIERLWQDELEAFKATRAKYLLYR